MNAMPTICVSMFSNLTDFCDTVTTQLTFNDSSGSSSDLCQVTSIDRPAVTPTESLTSPSDLLQSESLSCCSESHAIVTDIINDILSLTVSTNTTTTINGDFDETSDKRADDAVNAPDLTENAASSDNSISGSDVGVSVSGAAVVVPATEQSNNENTRTEARQVIPVLKIRVCIIFHSKVRSGSTFRTKKSLILSGRAWCWPPECFIVPSLPLSIKEHAP